LRNFSGANVYAIDLPSHGRSTGQGRKRADDYADVIESFVKTLDIGNVSLFGHSLGGAIVQSLALRRPQWLARIVLVGTGTRLRVTPTIHDGILSDPASTTDFIAQVAFGPSASEALVREFRESLISNDPTVTHGDFSACNHFDITEKVAEIAYPTLIVAGTADKMTPIKYGEYLHTQIPGARMLIIEDGGHMMALEKTEEFMAGVSDFLETRPLS
jgi:pimeloyl-ACP methyl ester carboxylesterase